MHPKSNVFEPSKGAVPLSVKQAFFKLNATFKHISTPSFEKQYSGALRI